MARRSFRRSAALIVALFGSVLGYAAYQRSGHDAERADSDAPDPATSVAPAATPTPASPAAPAIAEAAPDATSDDGGAPTAVAEVGPSTTPIPTEPGATPSEATAPDDADRLAEELAAAPGSGPSGSDAPVQGPASPEAPAVAPPAVAALTPEQDAARQEVPEGMEAPAKVARSLGQPPSPTVPAVPVVPAARSPAESAEGTGTTTEGPALADRAPADPPPAVAASNDRSAAGEPAGADAAAPESAPAASPPADSSVAATAEPPSDAAEAETTAPEPGESLVAATIRRALAAILPGDAEPQPDPPNEPGSDPEIEVAARAQQGAGDDAAPASAASDAAIEPGAPPPSFDVVRVGPDGRAVIAGRAEPGADVEVRSGDRVIDRVVANRRGEWVVIPAEPLPPGDQELTLLAKRAGEPAVESTDVVVIAVPEPPPPQPPATAVAELPPPQPAEVAAATPPEQAVAVLLPRDGKGSGRVLQAPGRISSDGKLALMVVDYDDQGRTRLTGEAPPGAPVRVYVDNQAAAEVVVSPSGKWTVPLERDLAPGDYTLRLDQLDQGGQPVARLETPFTRVSEPPVGGQAVDYVIVQPGNSLWRIARRLFGSGYKYVYIFEANTGQIRDPDLIYPGQVFEVPAEVSQSG